MIEALTVRSRVMLTSSSLLKELEKEERKGNSEVIGEENDEMAM